MKKLIPFILLLSACSTPSRESPEQILSKAVVNTQKLESVTIDVEGAGTLVRDEDTTIDAHIQASGSLQNTSRELELTIQGNGIQTSGGEEIALTGVLDLILLSGDEFFINLREFGSEPLGSFMPEELRDHMVGKWYLLKGSDTPASSSISIDPDILRAQTEVIQFEEDLGSKILDGITVEHFRISINPKKLKDYTDRTSVQDQSDLSMNATGEVWIDTMTHQMRKLSWDISELLLENGQTLDAQVDLQFSNHNSAPSITPPRDYLRFSPLMLLPFMDL